MKRILLYSVPVVAAIAIYIAVVGLPDPTANKADAGGKAAKTETEIEVVDSDVTIALDADNTEIQWTGSNTAGQAPTGYFYELQGTAVIDSQSNKLKKLEFVIDMSSVKAMAAALTEKLKNNGFFEVEKFPVSTFVMTGLSEPRDSDPSGTTHVIEGNFQLRDVKKSIQFPAELSVDAKRMTLKSEFKINRKDYGVVYENAIEDKLIRDDVLLNINLEAKLDVAGEPRRD